MLLPPHVPQPIDSENGSALSKLPPVAKAMRLVDDDATHRQREARAAAARSVRTRVMQPDRVAGALVAQQPIGERRGRARSRRPR